MFSGRNKRIAISLGVRFLIDNGYLAIAQRFVYKTETTGLHLAASRISKALLKELITSTIYKEELKLKYLEAISGKENI